jgi:DNA-binding NtrC family response regulator
VLERHAWPGNIRELENAIGHASMMAEGDEIDVVDLPAALLGEPTSSDSDGRSAPPTQPVEVQEDASLAEHERQLVVSALEKANGNQSHAARALGIGRDALRYKMKKYGLL